MHELKPHPAAEVFPLMEDAEFDALVKDIEEHGQREAITLLDGAILDGRNRYRALLQLKLAPKIVHWNSDGSPEAYVVSKNIMRRHLTQSQRSMILSRLATRSVGDQRGAISNNSRLRELTAKQAAKLGGLSTSLIFDANAVRKRGTPEEIQQVESGEVYVRAVAENIRARKPRKPGTPKAKRPNTATEKNQGRIQTARMMGHVWKDLKAGLLHLAALPHPAEVVKIARHSDRQNIVDSKLSLAIEWLKEFKDEWNRDTHA